MTDDTRKVTTRPADNLTRLCGEQVSITFGKDDKQHFSHCFGVCPDAFIMTQIPVGSGIEKNLTPGNTAVIRFVESGMVCGFKASIKHAITHPYRLVFFDYPESLEVINLRSSKRIAISLNATIQKDGEDFDGTIRDLSDGGCFFVMNYWQDPFWDDLSMETDISIKFKTHENEASVELKCKPVRFTKDQDVLSMGLAFGDNPQASLDKVAKFIEFVSQYQQSTGIE